MYDRYKPNADFIFFLIAVITGIAITGVVINPEAIASLFPTQSAPPNVTVLTEPLTHDAPDQTEVHAVNTLTKDQFPDGHHVLVCNPTCNFGIWNAAANEFYMGMDKTALPYTDDLAVYPHVDEGSLEVGQNYVECTLTTYYLVVNGNTFIGCFEGIFQGRDNGGYHFLSNGQIMTLPHTHGAFLSPNSH